MFDAGGVLQLPVLATHGRGSRLHFSEIDPAAPEALDGALEFALGADSRKA
jgi:hypothetical protein